MILGLLFSKDRALQLDACLASFGRHVGDVSVVELVVVYSASSAKFLRQYEELARWWDGKARFVPEMLFRSRVLEILGSAGKSRAGAESRFLQASLWRKAWPAASENLLDCVLFLVDDTLFVRSLKLAAVQAALRAHPDALGFSLRLGRNTTHNYVLNRQQDLPTFENVGSGILTYNWTQADGDFGYPLEISSSLYRLATIQRLVPQLSFSDPNTLESQMALRARQFSRKNPAMLCPENSVAFSAPINRVQDVYENRSGASPEWSTERLAAKFDSGFRIDVAALDDFVPSACHQEVELSFEPRAAQPTGE